jgi:hypothetical protein
MRSRWRQRGFLGVVVELDLDDIAAPAWLRLARLADSAASTALAATPTLAPRRPPTAASLTAWRLSGLRLGRFVVFSHGSKRYSLLFA